MRLGDFNREAIIALYLQHAQETGQLFESAALDLVWDLTQGQPWSVNALANEVIFEMTAGRRVDQPITVDMIGAAKENLILRHETHLDQLAHHLQEDRVRRVIAPILAGEENPEKVLDDDVTYVRDLGLIEVTGQLRIANPIYQEIIPRQLTFSTQLTISHETAWYVAADGRLDLLKLLAAFQGFFREHSEHWLKGYDYIEAGPQLLLQAFLQRIVNGGGRVEREYGLGRMRTDLLVIRPVGETTQKAVIELKVVHKGRKQTIVAGLQQTWEYMDRCGAGDGHLVLFDRDPKRSWGKKIFQRTETYKDTTIEVWGM